MKRRSPFVTKILYLVVVAALLVPLAWLSQPSTTDASGRTAPGGVLAQLRNDHNLSQAKLGEIDPTSEAIKLATLGMRGVAANILWSRSHHYKKTKDWTNYSATLEQITHLQPNFIEVWRHQAWNLSYNVSHEFDDYRDRYTWVIKGIDFLREGWRLNDREPRLAWEMGWVISNKIGKADEHVQFRQLFVEDDDFHDVRPLEERDNWLLGQVWIERAEQLVEDGERLVGRNPLVFFAYRPLCQISYANSLEEDGRFNDPTADIAAAWEQAERLLVEYGNRAFAGPEGREIRLEALEDILARATQLADALEALEPGLRETIRQEKFELLSDDQRAALEVDVLERSATEAGLARAAEASLRVSHEEVVERISGSEAQQEQAREIAAQLALEEQLAGIIVQSRDTVNYDVWKMRCKAEQTAGAIEARRLIYEADRALADADLVTAKKLYEDGFRAWRDVFDRFPPLINDGQVGYDLVHASRRYEERLLKQIDESMPADFILQDILDLHEVDRLPEPSQ